MQVNGEFKLKAPRQTVWDMLNDPEVLAASIPGADRFVSEGEDRYRAEMSVGIGMIRGKFGGTVEVKDKLEPERYRMLVEGKGPGGWLKGDGLLNLNETGAEETTVSVDGDATVGGLLARVGQRMIGNASNSLMKQFFSNLEKEIRRRQKA